MTAKTGSVVRNCLICDVEFRTNPSQVANGKGKFCSVPCGRQGRRTVITKPAPTAITPKHLDRLLAPVGLDNGGAVRCAGPGPEHYRERGQMCRSCEWRAFQEVAS